MKSGNKSHLNSNRNPLEILYSTKEIAKDPIKIIKGISVDFRRLIDKRYLVKKLCQIIQNPDQPMNLGVSTQWRVSVIEFLENFLRSPFTSTKVMKMKTEDYLNGFEVRKKPVGERMKLARRKNSWTQKELAMHLGYKSYVSIIQFERGSRFPPKKIFQWLEKVECNTKRRE